MIYFQRQRVISSKNHCNTKRKGGIMALTPKQKKLPKALQEAILKSQKKGKKKKKGKK